MAFIYREWRTVAAGVFAFVAIGGAYLIATGAGAPHIAEASTETALLAQIANKDSSGDGLPDWQKALYGIPLDATTTDYFHLGMTDGEAVAKGLIVPIAATPAAPAPATSTPDTAASFGLTAPASGSLTDAFAQNFFALYTAAEQSAGGSLTDDQINDVAQEALTELSNSTAPAPDFKQANDLKVSGSGSLALISFAGDAENVLRAYSISLPESELEYLQDDLNGDSTAAENLAKLGTEYTTIATGLAALPVPAELKSADLELVNSAARMGDIITDFSNEEADPLSAMLALQQYPQALAASVQAYTDIASVYASAGVAIPAGSPGAQFINAANYIKGSNTTP